MIQVLSAEKIVWICNHRQWPDEPPCGRISETGLEEIRYMVHPRSANRRSWVTRLVPQAWRGKRLIPEQTRGQGAVLALPGCIACGGRTFLKADYSLEELFRAAQPVQNEHGQVWTYVLPLSHVRNLRLLWALYERGLAKHAPLVELAPTRVLSYPALSGIDTDCIHALWWGYLAVQAIRPELLGAGQAADISAACFHTPLRDLRKEDVHVARRWNTSKRCDPTLPG